MARVKFQAGISSINGKLNGSHFSKGKSGTFSLKNTPVKNIVNSKFNILQKSRMDIIKHLWLTNTPDNTFAWNVLASHHPYIDDYGDSIYLSGYNLFSKFNRNLLTAEQSTFSKVVPMGSVQQWDRITLTASTVSLIIDGNPSSVPAGYTLLIFATKCLSSGYSSKSLPFVWILNRFEFQTLPFDIFPNYVEHYGTPVAGMKIFIKVCLVKNDSGQVSLSVFDSDIV